MSLGLFGFNSLRGVLEVFQCAFGIFLGNSDFLVLSLMFMFQGKGMEVGDRFHMETKFNSKQLGKDA